MHSASFHVTVVGAGAVGLSWTGLFLANGLRVTIHDQRPDIQLAALSGLEGIKCALQSLGYKIEKFTRHLSFEQKLHKAVCNADIIQESIPEDLEAKQVLYEKLGRFAKSSALILSSSATLPASLITHKMINAGRVLVGHPFNPPHLIPLVELVPGKKTTQKNIDSAMAFYRRLGKHPVLVQKETTGYVANRLQFALLRESIHLVRSGIITVDKLDEIVRASLGPCLAAAGPFKSFALDSPNGLTHFLEQFDVETRTTLRKQSDDCYARVPVEDLQKEKEEGQIAILKALGKQWPHSHAPIVR